LNAMHKFKSSIFHKLLMWGSRRALDRGHD
jgi:hypothetical protein